jgi:NAD(P)H-flavin reductase
MGVTRVLIVGGGLSGLLSLVQARFHDAQVDVLEASPVLGGRERRFGIDLDTKNREFLIQIGIVPGTLNSENAYTIVKAALLRYLESQSVKDVRVIHYATATSILTDQEKKTALGIGFKRRSVMTTGKPYETDCRIFGDSLIFAIGREEIKNLCHGDFKSIEEGKILMAQGHPLFDVYFSKDHKTVSLNSFITQARAAGKAAVDAIYKNVLRCQIKQPWAFMDKEGVFHGVALKPDAWVPLTLENRIQLNKFNHLFRFALPEPTMQVGLFCGQYILLRSWVDGEEIIRSYSPVSRNSDYGHVDLIIKIDEDTSRKPMERVLSALQPGQAIEFMGPAGGFDYHRNMYRQVGMIAGGTGITPMVQIIRSVANHPEDDTELKLLYGNYNEEDILCRDELSYYSLTRSNISVYISLVYPPGKWTMGTGFVNE